MSLERTVHVFELADFHFQAKEGLSHHLSTRHVPDPTLLCAAERQTVCRCACNVHTAMLLDALAICAVCIQENCRFSLTPTFWCAYFER